MIVPYIQDVRLSKNDSRVNYMSYDQTLFGHDF